MTPQHPPANSPALRPLPAPADGGDEGETGDNNFLRTTLLVVLERKWYALAVFVVTVAAAAVYTYLSQPVYSAVVTIQVLKQGTQVLRMPSVFENSITSDVDFNTQIKVLDSFSIVQAVANRLTPEEEKLLTEPYATGGNTPSAMSIIYNGRRITPIRSTLITAIEFRHPNPKMAARIPNLFAAEYIAYNSRLRVEESLKAVDDLKDRAEQQRRRVDELANSLQAFRQRGNLISLMQSKDIVTDKLKAQNSMATQTGARLKEAEVRWLQVQEWIKSGRDMAELTFVSAQPKVSQLLGQLTGQRQTVAQLRERYQPKHPRLIEAVNAVTEGERELHAALETAANSIKADYENALQNDAAARQALQEQEARSLELDKASVEYENLVRDFRVNEQLLESMMVRMREASVTSSMEVDSARIVDRASEPSTPVSPRVGANLAMGVVGGIFLGFAFAFLLATVDDRIKNAFDVESLVGLPLLGVVPGIEKMEQPDKAQIVANGADRLVAEAFLSLYSTLRISELSRNARLIMVTSTIPGEGKSFIASNLALTFAGQGARTILVDCDLRKPAVQQSFRLSPPRGLIHYCQQGAKLEEIISRNVHPSLDVITVGGRAKNPIQLLNSHEFESLVLELARRYDRVIFDTPPLGAVSDALNILSMMDGVIYTIRHNFVKRGMAQTCVRQLRTANITIFGAVLNAVRAGGGGEYYVENSKLFRKYYADNAADPVARASG